MMGEYLNGLIGSNWRACRIKTICSVVAIAAIIAYIASLFMHNYANNLLMLPNTQQADLDYWTNLINMLQTLFSNLLSAISILLVVVLKRGALLKSLVVAAYCLIICSLVYLVQILMLQTKVRLMYNLEYLISISVILPLKSLVLGLLLQFCKK